MKLVDDDGNDVEVGVSGEIWSRGPDLFIGYTNALEGFVFGTGQEPAPFWNGGLQLLRG